MEWFRSRVVPEYGDVTCDAILKGGKPDVSLCGQLLSDAWDTILNLLVENGIDPATPKE